MKRQASIKNWFNSGEPWIWLNAGAVSLSIIMVVGLVALIMVRGLGHFWPSNVAAFDYTDSDGTVIALAGEFVDYESVPRARSAGNDSRIAADLEVIDRSLVRIGNRDYTGFDYRWVLDAAMRNLSYPEQIMAVERYEWGNFYGYLKAVKENGEIVDADPDWELFQQYVAESGEILEEIHHIEKNLIGAVNYEMERLRLRERVLVLNDEPPGSQVFGEIETRRASLQEEYNDFTARLSNLYGQLNRASFVATLAGGQEAELLFAKVVRAYRPNAMNVKDKTVFYFEKLWEFVSGDPREANTEGGIFPAIFGTVLMVMIMAVLVTPFGVVAAVYLKEYARQGPFTRLIRIAVNNLAGVPSVVYGVFGLGFFVYFLGGTIDELFFPESLPAPTFGTPGIMWASLTMAILTVPVVIVSTEEGLARVPRAIREGSLALGATKAETLWRTVLPMTASAMLTGLILAIARAAGEVAPLMLVGVVKLAPSMPLDGNFPFLHLDRKFMHLGFHIYDVGFQSPNVEAARPLVYATAFLLILIIIFLNLAAIKVRNTLREKYRAAEQH
ncbi:MAG: phosphate ABC transporter permease PstA [Gammaproteobacteria bacterium]|nr:phosphate ABC transporter permease PstA [Gammaproteobacteria bacterium]